MYLSTRLCAHRTSSSFQTVVNDAWCFKQCSFTVNDWQVTVFTSIEPIRALWDDHIPANSLHGSAYASALEQALPANIIPLYAVVRDAQQTCIALLPLQILDFKGDERINEHQWKGESAWWNAIKGKLVSFFHYRLLIYGNALATGEFMGWVQEQYSHCVPTVLEGIAARQPKYIHAIVCKDFYESGLGWKKWSAWNYHALRFQPAMNLTMRPHWKSWEDYLGDMTSKYRVRARRAYTKSESLVVMPITDALLPTLENDMHQLLTAVCCDADFTLLNVHPGFFRELVAGYGKHCTIVGYFEQEQLVGFSLALHTGADLEAHFVGFDSRANHVYQLYLRMLYDFVKLGIQLGVEQVSFARTALEIKSSVGAEASEMLCMVHARPRWGHWALPYVLRWYNPKVEWQPRHPFSV